MTDFDCPKCEKQFTTEEFPFGDDVQCTHCKTWFETDSEYDWDNCYAWITGERKEEDKK